MDKSKIMKQAWVVARRFEGNGWSLRQRLAHGLKCVWYQAKTEKYLAEVSAWEAAQQAAIPTEQLRYELTSLENADFIGQAGIQRMAEIRAELHRRAAQ